STHPYPSPLSKEDRGRSNATYDDFGLSISMYEASPEVSPFSSKFDYALAHPDKPVLSPDEWAGWNLLRGGARCTTCHLDGTENAPGTSPPMKPANAASVAPLFTDFTSNNIGVPRNPGIPYYSENVPDKYGYVANPSGQRYVDRGVGDFLRGPDNIDRTWRSYAKSFDGKFQTSTLRNVDKRQPPDLV